MQVVDQDDGRLLSRQRPDRADEDGLQRVLRERLGAGGSSTRHGVGLGRALAQVRGLRAPRLEQLAQHFGRGLVARYRAAARGGARVALAAELDRLDAFRHGGAPQWSRGHVSPEPAREPWDLGPTAAQ